ncbi:hypothetical protein QCA50_006121 [Cerrena zonata]|uniref:Uncharacterized protein n=1 Tax=Cerrena zonata TaxID=2478898 RepID=A0AAW0GC42_9APHY
MPTVPPQCIPRTRPDDDEPHVPSVLANQLHLVCHSPGASGPTPDPDLDDMLLVSADGVGVVSSVSSQDNPPDHVASDPKPRLSLNEIAFHSPSSIIGTPFDISPRFEYPFPLSSEPDPITLLSTSSITSPLSHLPGPYLPSAPSMVLSTPMPLARPTYSTHLKLKAKPSKEPPVPPGLAKKRWSINLNINTKVQHVQPAPVVPSRPRTRARSSSEVVPPQVENIRCEKDRSVSVERSASGRSRRERRISGSARN